MEAFCEFSAYDIIRSSIQIKDSFPDSLVYAKEEMDKYSAVVNYAKYFPYLSYCPEDFFIFSEESEPFINPLDDQGRFVKNPLQSRLISLFSILNKESRFKLLESPPKSRNELLRLSRGPFDSSCCLLN